VAGRGTGLPRDAARAAAWNARANVQRVEAHAAAARRAREPDGHGGRRRLDGVAPAHAQPLHHGVPARAVGGREGRTAGQRRVERRAQDGGEALGVERQEVTPIAAVQAHPARQRQRLHVGAARDEHVCAALVERAQQRRTHRGERACGGAGAGVVAIGGYVEAARHLAVRAVAIDVQRLAHGAHGAGHVVQCADGALAAGGHVAVAVHAVPGLDAVEGVRAAQHTGGRERVAAAHQVALGHGRERAVHAAGAAVVQVVIAADRVAEVFVHLPVAVVVALVAGLGRRHALGQHSRAAHRAARAAQHIGRRLRQRVLGGGRTGVGVGHHASQLEEVAGLAAAAPARRNARVIPLAGIPGGAAHLAVHRAAPLATHIRAAGERARSAVLVHGARQAQVVVRGHAHTGARGPEARHTARGAAHRVLVHQQTIHLERQPVGDHALGPACAAVPRGDVPPQLVAKVLVHAAVEVLVEAVAALVLGHPLGDARVDPVVEEGARATAEQQRTGQEAEEGNGRAHGLRHYADSKRDRPPCLTVPKLGIRVP
jgi:hypothetical protein